MNEMQIVKIAEGAYFVPSYSDQAIASFQPGITNQTVISTQDPDMIDEFSEQEPQELPASPPRTTLPKFGEES